MLKSWNESLWLLSGEICCSDFLLKKKKKAKIQMVNFYEESSNCGSQGEC